MANIEHIRKRIAEISSSVKNVELSDIQWIVEHLGKNGYATSCKSNEHQYLFCVNGKRFGVCHHNPGNKQIKSCYVREFLGVMEDLGLHDDD